jgi:hypothetical protein
MHISKIVAVAVLGIFAAEAAFTVAAEGADSASPIVGQFPNTEGNAQQLLFMLKKNDISEPISAQDFCRKLDYGEAVLWDRAEEIKEQAIVPGNLNWVVCRFKNK